MLKEITLDIYHLLHPKMAFFLTSADKKGNPNVMTCAWATPVSEEPPLVVEGCIGYIECRLWKAVDAGECYAFFGKVLSAYGDDNYIEKGLWTKRAEIPLHLGGSRIVYFK